MNDVFKQHPDLEKYYTTSDGESFYNENDAKNYAKTLKVKTVETVFNENFLEVIDTEDLTDEQIEMAKFEADQKAQEEIEAAEKIEADKKAQEEIEAAEKIEADKKAQEEIEAAEKADLIDLSKMTKAELLAYANEQKLIIVDPKATNAVLVEEIANQLNSQK